MPSDHLTAVLAHSRHAGSHLLVLLVIAINAGPPGVWITDQATLQRQARLSRRRIRQILSELAATGELAVVPGRGRGNRSTFQLLIAPASGAAECPVSSPPSPPFPPDPQSPPTPKKPKTDETFGLSRRPLAGPQHAVLQINLMFHQAGIQLPPPAQIGLWLKTLGGVEPLAEVLTRLIESGLAGKDKPSAYVHRVVMKQATTRSGTAAPEDSNQGTRHRQAARLAGLAPRPGKGNPSR